MHAQIKWINKYVGDSTIRNYLQTYKQPICDCSSPFHVKIKTIVIKNVLPENANKAIHHNLFSRIYVFIIPSSACAIYNSNRCEDLILVQLGLDSEQGDGLSTLVVRHFDVLQYSETSKGIVWGQPQYALLCRNSILTVSYCTIFFICREVCGKPNANRVSSRKNTWYWYITYE